MSERFARNGMIGIGIALLLLLTMYAVLAIAPRNASADHGVLHGVIVEPLTPVVFPDQIDARFKIKLNTGGTQVIHVRDLDHVMNAKLTFEPGGEVPWHTHPGPVVVTVQQGSLTITNAIDCVARVYEAGQGFVDPGHGNIHKAVNESGGVTVVQATFFEVPIVDGTPRPTILADNPGC